jgi:uncharacterized Zn-binding protein involved in type VI secretion
MTIQCSVGRLGITQTVAFDTTTPVTNAFAAGTYAVRLVANAACNFRIYDSTASATATAADPFLPANWETIITVSPGQKISALKAATNGLVTATAGTLWVTELS